MALTGYIPVPAAATVGGAPIDAFQGDAFRQNDVKFEEYLRSILHTPLLLNDGRDGVQTHAAGGLLHATNKIWRATEFHINAPWVMNVGWPLIILATIKITVNDTIDGKGKGRDGDSGHFGGSGGGGGAGTAGRDIVMPLSGTVLKAGGAVGTNNGLAFSGDDIAHFLLPIIHLLKGGAAGGDVGAVKGGKGGGLVVLAAPEIEFTATGFIDVEGENGSGAVGAGGGGGGGVILIAKNITPTPAFHNPYQVGDKVKTKGGDGNAPGGGVVAGGNGGAGWTYHIPVH